MRKESLPRVCQTLIRNCDKTRLRKKEGLPEEQEDEDKKETEKVEKEWTQARNMD